MNNYAPFEKYTSYSQDKKSQSVDINNYFNYGGKCKLCSIEADEMMKKYGYCRSFMGDYNDCPLHNKKNK
jgi:hypothetical protein